MKSVFRNMFFLLCGFLLLEACSPKIYRPPALGAEYQFDRGLPPAKHPSQLFDKGMQDYLEKRGIASTPTTGKEDKKPASRQDSISRDSSAVQDSSQRIISPTTLHPGNKVLPDSSRNVRH